MNRGSLQLAISQPGGLIDDRGFIAVTSDDLIEKLNDGPLDIDIIEPFEREIGWPLLVDRQIAGRGLPAIIAFSVRHLPCFQATNEISYHTFEVWHSTFRLSKNPYSRSRVAIRELCI